jgi:hypothetical protein
MPVLGSQPPLFILLQHQLHVVICRRWEIETGDATGNIGGHAPWHPDTVGSPADLFIRWPGHRSNVHTGDSKPEQMSKAM